MLYDPNRRQIPRRTDLVPTPVAIQLHDQPDQAVAETSVPVVKRPFGFNPVLWFHFIRLPRPGSFVS